LGTVLDMEERRTEDLEVELARFAHLPDLVAGLRHALGAETPELPLDPARFPVVAFLLRPMSDVFSAWFLTPGRFIVHERNPGGDTLTVVLPLSRIARVSESDVSGVLTVTVELDADLVSVDLVSANQPTDGNEPGKAVLSGRATPASYVLAVADTPTRLVAYRFMSSLSRAMGA
jgi:hypothetical protein